MHVQVLRDNFFARTAFTSKQDRNVRWGNPFGLLLTGAIAFETPKTVASSGMPSATSDSCRVSGKSMKDRPLRIQCKQRGYQHQIISAFPRKIVNVSETKPVTGQLPRGRAFSRHKLMPSNCCILLHLFTLKTNFSYDGVVRKVNLSCPNGTHCGLSETIF